MIRCTLELIPGGYGEPEHLGVIEIGNQLDRSHETGGMRGDYVYELEKKRKGRITHKGRINNFPRLSYHPWNLIQRVLNDAAKNGVI